MKPLTSKLYPKTRLLNSEFKYRHSFNTDIRETFKRVREEIPTAKAKIRRVR